MDSIEKIVVKLWEQAKLLPQSILTQIFFWLGMLAALYFLAQISWKLFPDNTAPSQWAPTPIIQSTSVQKDNNLAELKNLTLFGANSKSDKPTAIKPVELLVTNAPKTSLTIQLTGVVASTSQQNGLAVIASNGGQHTYSLGDKIKGTSASLKEVYADRVIIINSGRFETLMLDGLKFEANSTANQQLQRAKAPKRVDRREDAVIASQLAASKELLLSDPNKITDIITISPVRKGADIQGYRLNPGKNRELFNQAGFKANDLAKNMNGYDLTSITESMEVLAQLPELTELSVVVERDEQLIEILLSLPE